jgi:hypothetical protein
MRCHGARVLLTLCLAGCSFDLTDLPGETRATFHVQLFANTLTDQLAINASLAPGVGSDASSRTVLTGLLVAGRPVPSWEAADGSRTYAAEWSLSADLPRGGSLELHAPELAGMPASATPAFRVTLPARAGPDTLHVDDGDDVILHVDLPADGTGSAQWAIDVSDSAGAVHFTIQSAGYPPPQIVIPATWFSSASPAHRVRLHVHQEFLWDMTQDQYAATASVDALLHWTVVFATDPEP